MLEMGGYELDFPSTNRKQSDKLDIESLQRENKLLRERISELEIENKALHSKDKIENSKEDDKVLRDSIKDYEKMIKMLKEEINLWKFRQFRMAEEMNVIKEKGKNYHSS